MNGRFLLLIFIALFLNLSSKSIVPSSLSAKTTSSIGSGKRQTPSEFIQLSNLIFHFFNTQKNTSRISILSRSKKGSHSKVYLSNTIRCNFLYLFSTNKKAYSNYICSIILKQNFLFPFHDFL